LRQFFNADEEQQIAAAFAKSGFANLTGAFEALGAKIDFGRLRLFRAAQARQQLA